MFEAERERCYEGIRQCDEFLQVHVLLWRCKNITADKVFPENALAYFSGKHGSGAVIFHLKAKMHFIRRLIDMQEAENALYVD